ncbi:HD domain-containing protein [Rhodanobacter sp. Si-c]|uniref:HD domain-containing protein n=1 Tax=Rhodanobacter lycopersici TaxID=3162487 RepID=A0ABV3QGL5_9GAMM
MNENHRQHPGQGARSLSERADELEHRMIDELEQRIVKSVLFVSGDKDPRTMNQPPPPGSKPDRRKFLMGDDPRLPKMPETPTLLDFFRNRFGSPNHVLQSATHALKGGHDEKTVLACLLHDIAVAGFIRADHGYWGAQLIAPYVDEEVSWAIRYHQALRFFPDEAAGYTYPEAYIRYFGPDYQVEDYVRADYEYARNHKWYMTSRLITLNDIYSFDPNAKVSWDPFMDIIGRHFKQPKEGLGFDGSPVAHMWRTIIWPTKFL